MKQGDQVSVERAIRQAELSAVQTGGSAGLVWGLCGFVMLSMGDTVTKTMAGAWAPTAAAATRYTMGAAGLGLLLAFREGRAGFRMPRPELQLLRGFGVAIATICFFSALFVMPLAEATAIGFSSPVITAVLATLLLREPARRETWLATLFAFAGVLIVLRPNVAALGVTAFLPLISACGMSMLMIGNRASAGLASPLAMQFFVASIAAPMLIVMALIAHASGIPQLHIGVPSWSVVARCALVAITATTGHWAIFKATSRAGASAIAPMAYVQLLVVGALGWLVFNERPDAMMLLGAAMIVAAGICLWWAGRVSEPVTAD